MNSRIEKACYEVILNTGTIPKENLDKVYSEAENSNHGFSELLVRNGLLKETDLLEIYSKSLGIPLLNLNIIEVDKSLLSKIPIKFSWYYKFFPVKLRDRRLTIAISRLLDINTVDEIRLGLGYEIEIALSRQREIEDMLKRYYGLGAETVDKILSQSGGDNTVATHQPTDELQDIEKLADTPSVVQLVNQIILDAYRRRASDIHIEPFRDRVRLRYRIDGILHEARVPPELKQFFSAILSRIKIMANLNIVERRLPQDGKARVKTQDQSLDLRISSIPTPFGESMVIRILPSKMIYNLEQLGLEPHYLEVFRNLIQKPYGIIFVTGPTGSGKSTTLYAGLQAINATERKIVTIEDPIEYEMEGITQIQVLPEIGLTFARGLRSMLRHDPDVMMVGEVRDFETADIAIRVALTGHLILSTLHTNDAASGITRLLDIGIEPYLISSSVIAFVAQRLVRVICLHCKKEDEGAGPEVKKMIAQELNLHSDQPVKVFIGKGCDECYHTGYSGRIAIHEIILINEEMRRMIFSRATADEIREKARSWGMDTLRQDGWRKVLRGITTPKEIIQATSADEKISGGRKREKEPTQKVLVQKPAIRYENKRKYDRIKARIPFLYRVIESLDHSSETKEGAKLFGKCETENISAGGMLFSTRDTFQKSNVLELKLDLPDGGPAIECLGRVVRVSRSLDSLGPEGKFQFQVAILFLVINSQDRSRLENLCKQGDLET